MEELCTVTVTILGLSRLACLLELVHLTLVKPEASCFLLGEVGQVEGYSDEVGLGSVVRLVCIVVDDHFVTVVFSGGHVLEVVQVERVGQDVVRVDTLECLTGCLGSFLHLVVLLIRKQRQVEARSAVKLFTLAPLAVLIVERGPVRVDVLIDFEVTDG